MKKRNFLVILISVLCLTYSCSTQEKKYTISCDFSEISKEGLVLIRGPYVIEGAYDTIMYGNLKDGKILFEGQISEIKLVNLDFKNGNERAKKQFILEPGNIDLKFKAKAIQGKDKQLIKASLNGGKYNEQAINSWEEADYYKNLDDKFFELVYSDTESLTEGEKKARSKGMYKCWREITDYKIEHLNKIFESSSDPILRFNALQLGAYQNQLDTLIEKLSELEKDLPDYSSLKILLKQRLHSQLLRDNSNQISEQGVIKNFKAQNLKGEEINLADVIKENKYVLVEFWASWCAPCRQEIPHMKKAYKHFNTKGFEIVSFTLDDKKKNWEKASSSENLPWVNVGDLKAFKSPVAIMYGITGVPANFLVESASGKIIAKDLRGPKLDEMLDKLLK